MPAGDAVPQAGALGANPSEVNPCRLPVRVAFFTNCIAPYFLPVLQQLAQRVASLRVFVSVTMEADRPWEPRWGGVDVTLQKSLTTKHRRNHDHGFATTFYRHFPYDTLLLLHRNKPDVIVSAQLGFRTAQAVLYRLANRTTRLVLWVDGSQHTEREVGRAQTILRRALLSVADAVIVNGTSGAGYAESLGVPAGQIIMAPYVSTSKEKAEISRPPEARRRLLYVGQLIERKGVHLLLRQLADWAATNPQERLEVWIVGEGVERKKLEQTRLPDNIEIKFFGNVDYSEVYKLYGDAGIFVLPCFADTWGLVVNEAMQAGLPVLGSRYSQAVEELVLDGVNGWTFYPDRYESFCEALVRALAAPEQELERMRERAQASVRHLTAEYSAEQFVESIRVALGSSSASKDYGGVVTVD